VLGRAGVVGARRARAVPGQDRDPGRHGRELNPLSKENEICESAVLNHRAINATNTVRNDNRVLD
jgi:hypothetical protein